MAKHSRLQETEKAVLEFVELRANATVAEIAKGAGLKPHRVRHVLDSLIERKLLHRYVHLNVYPLGYFEVDVMVALNDRTTSSLEQIIRWCLGHEKVCFLSEIGGDFDLKIGLTVKSMSEVSEFMSEVCERFKHPVARKRILIIRELYDFGVHKGKGDATIRTLQFGHSKDSYELLKGDHEILQILSAEPSLPPSVMARKLGIGGTTLRYRLDRLEEAGVIAGYRYLYDPQGRTLEYFHALIELGGVSAAARKVVHSFCTRHVNIPFYAEVVGEVDFIVAIAVGGSYEALLVQRSITEAVAPFGGHVELYPSPTLRKLVKYPFR